MLDLVYTDLVDRSNYPQHKDAPWNDEPDLLLSKYRGYNFVIMRHSTMGFLCGYAAVHTEHPLYGKDYDEIYEVADIAVHGGFTFSGGALLPKDTQNFKGYIKHKEPLWWFGFDCAHGNDYVPMFAQFPAKGIQTQFLLNYKTVGFVYAELINVIRKLHEIGGEGPDVTMHFIPRKYA